MILVEAVFALATAFLLTVIFVALGRRARSWRRIVVFFSLVLLAAWAGGVWITPVGPRLLGVYWLSFLVAGLIFALLQEALAASPKRIVPREKVDELAAKEEREIERIFNVFSFVLLIAFIAVIVIGYIRRS